MQVANALNNTIRILFNPKVEPFKLFDFLVVKSLEDRYLSQIVEIYDDKFDSSQNVAKIKLFYKITANNEVMPYDNFTPSKECEIVKVKPDEVENFINNGKETFVFATDTRNSQALNIQYDFFNKNAIVLADKIENANAVSLNLAKKLSVKKNTVIVDFTGILEFEEAKKIKACKNFKMPLNFNTLDLVFDRCLADASLEFQAIGIEILNAIKKFAKKQEFGFIPFNAFINVILEQYKATPYAELQLLLSRMKKYQMFDIFAKSKKDYETLSKTIEKNAITIVDLSGIDKTWQKAYLEYIISEIEQEIYFITRINDESFDTDLINKIYNEKTNIKFVPNVSYNYSKLPSIMQNCKNYILLPSLYQRNDFLDANFAISNLLSNQCVLFGENTDNFLYLACDFELETQEKRKNYRKIALSLLDDEQETSQPKEDKVSESQKLMQELSALEEKSKKEHDEEQQNNKEVVYHDEFQEINQKPNAEEIPKEVETIKNIQEVELSNEPPEILSTVEIKNEPQKDEFNSVENATEEDKQDVFQSLGIQTSEKESETLQEDTNQYNQETISIEKIIAKEDNNKTDISQENVDDKKDIDVSDEELDFFELAEATSAASQGENLVIDNVEYKVQSDNFENNIKETTEDKKGEDDLDLSEVASNAIENNFEDIINAKRDIKKTEFEIDEDTKIQVDVEEDKETELPIFKDESEKEQKDTANFIEGGSVIHAKYGKGKIVKIIQYDQRQLLQIEFEESGKKLLDPKIAEIKSEN